MKALFTTVKNLFLKKDFILFVAIGGVNTLTSIVVSYLLSDWFNPNVSYVIGYMVGFMVSYLLNSFFTFHEALSFGKLIKYAIATVPNFLIQNGVVILCYNILGWHKLVAYVLAAAIGVPVTFLLQKFFTFGKRKG
ncbi:MAG: GtrA family protein [Clostridia bacterium]|nr:GtrA family protein [Clostridia bacterium]